MHKMNVKNRAGLVKTHLLRGRYVLENKDVLMKYSLALLLILSFASSVSAVEDNQPCVEETRALMNVSSSWEAILKSMQDLPVSCFDGYFAEGISDTFVRKLGAEWDSFHLIYPQFKNNPQVNEIILKSFNATVLSKDLEKIIELGKNRCPNNKNNICNTLTDAAKKVLSE